MESLLKIVLSSHNEAPTKYYLFPKSHATIDIISFFKNERDQK